MGYFRQLYEGLHGNEDRRRYLNGAWRTAAEQLAELAPLRKRERAPAGEDAWQLYALSRVSDYLIELFCPEGDPPAGFGVTGGRAVITGSDTDRLEQGGYRISTIPGWHASRVLEPDGLATHTEFFSAVGLTPFEHAGAFSPFHHEIFAVVRDEAATTVTVEEVLWPGFWFGDLLFSRAGVRVRAPRHLIDAAVATTSTLYFTSRREPRPTHDSSHGWGSNSQWRTRFHRFYADDEGLHLNWDGEVDIGEDPPLTPPDQLDPDAPLDERRELLLYRCFVREQLPRDEDDRFPYGDRLSLDTTTHTWNVSGWK